MRGEFERQREVYILGAGGLKRGHRSEECALSLPAVLGLEDARRLHDATPAGSSTRFKERSTSEGRLLVLESYGFTTDALITHASGGLSYEDEWRAFQDQFFADDSLRNSARDCPALTIVTYSTYDEPTLLERCLGKSSQIL